MQLIDVVGSAALTFVSGATAWWFTRRQSKLELDKKEQELETVKALRESEVKGKELEIFERFNEIQKNIVNDLAAQLDGMKAEAKELRAEVQDRRKYADETRQEIQSLYRTIDVNKKDSEREIRKLRGELEKMKIEFPCADCPRRQGNLTGK